MKLTATSKFLLALLVLALATYAIFNVRAQDGLLPKIKDTENFKNAVEAEKHIVPQGVDTTTYVDITCKSGWFSSKFELQSHRIQQSELETEIKKYPHLAVLRGKNNGIFLNGEWVDKTAFEYTCELPGDVTANADINFSRNYTYQDKWHDPQHYSKTSTLISSPIEMNLYKKDLQLVHALLAPGFYPEKIALFENTLHVCGRVNDCSTASIKSLLEKSRKITVTIHMSY